MTKELEGSPPHQRTASSREAGALAIVALLAMATLVRLTVPVGTGVFLGALTAFTIRPAFDALRRKTGHRAGSAFVCAAATFGVVTAGIGGLLWLLVVQGQTVARRLPEALAAGGAVSQGVDRLARPLHDLGLSSATTEERLASLGDRLTPYATSFASTALSAALGFLVALFFTVVTVYFVLLQWARLTHWAEALMPLRPVQTRFLVRELRSLGREIVLGTVIVGLVQGLLAGLAYAVAGVPQAPFLGALTALASTVPVFGTMIVWVPAGLYLLATDHVAMGVVVLVWGSLVVVTLSDGLLRPKLVGRRSSMGLLPALIGIFGGVELFGFIGLLLGPTLVGISLALLRLYASGRARNGRPARIVVPHE